MARVLVHPCLDCPEAVGWSVFAGPLRKHVYLNILKILPPKNENFQIKSSDSFLISAQNIDCRYSLQPPRRGGSYEYLQSMFWAEIRKIIYTPVNPSFTMWKWGLRGSNFYRHVFVMQTNLIVGFVVRWHKQVKQNIKLKQNKNNNKNGRVSEKLLKILEFLSDTYIITIRTFMDRFWCHKVT